MMTKNDNEFMAETLKEAKKGWGKVSPNPLVGAIIVNKNDEIIGRGHHEFTTKYHAEINALNSALNNLKSQNNNSNNFNDKNQLLDNNDSLLLKDCDVYVTLEPCSTFGRTAPCTTALINCNVKRVFIGCVDDNELHANRAVKFLEDANIEVFCNINKEACQKINETFFKWIKTKKPFVILKMAMTLDGKIATQNGCSKWITGAIARQRVQQLREWSDAILIGGETARADKPSLTVRDGDNNIMKNYTQPERIILSQQKDFNYTNLLAKEGGRISVISLDNASGWNNLLLELGERNITSLLIEGGGEVAAMALNANIVDKIEFHIAPKILGGKDSRSVVGGFNPLDLNNCHQLKDIHIKQYGDDIAISGYCMKNSEKKSEKICLQD